MRALPDSAERAPAQETSPTSPRPEPFAGMTDYEMLDEVFKP